MNHGFSVFIDNLPYNLDRFGLKGIFRKAGWVKDSYIPVKRSRSLRRFGFIRFWREEDARNSIRMFNDSTIRGAKIRVCMARFGKDGIATNSQQRARSFWRKKSSEGAKVLSNHMEQDLSRTLKGEVNVTFLEWLSRSLICVSDVPRDLEMLSKQLVKDDHPKVYALTKFKFILTFGTIDQMEASLANHVMLDKWFCEVKKWDIYEVCDTRRVWIEVFGVPPHGWNQQNFENIASIWGKVVCLETPIEDTISFESMRILIDSDRLQTIEGHLLLHLGDAGYRIKVKEASYSFQINPQFIVPDNSSPSEVRATNKASQEVQVLDTDVAVCVDRGTCHWPTTNRLEGANSDGAARASTDFAFADRIAHQLHMNRKSPSRSFESRTKTAQFSQNGFSEEIVKHSQKETESQYIKNNDHEIKWAAEQRKCLGSEVSPSFSNPNSQVNEPAVPPGFETQIVEGCDETSAPPGFEVLQPIVPSPSQKIKTKEFQNEGLSRRLTRSQSKRGLVSTERNHKNVSIVASVDGSTDVSPHSKESSKTTESLAKLAWESLEVGEILGVKVIGKKDLALKRITSALKKERKVRKVREAQKTK